mmetsp:Transcript_12293/g.29819  ORF Transcript_12293/g.29819 Transcript_12293/m.29819 type:complete len:242 (+) Transcript_12293:5072-5797(+)
MSASFQFPPYFALALYFVTGGRYPGRSIGTHRSASAGETATPEHSGSNRLSKSLGSFLLCFSISSILFRLAVCASVNNRSKIRRCCGCGGDGLLLRPRVRKLFGELSRGEKLLRTSSCVDIISRSLRSWLVLVPPASEEEEERITGISKASWPVRSASSAPAISTTLCGESDSCSPRPPFARGGRGPDCCCAVCESSWLQWSSSERYSSSRISCMRGSWSPVSARGTAEELFAAYTGGSSS